MTAILKTMRRIPLSVPVMRGNEGRYLQECIDTNWVSYVGPFVERFETAFAQAVSAPYAVAMQSGTAALHVALLAAGVGRDDLVIVPDLTFIAPANAAWIALVASAVSTALGTMAGVAMYRYRAKLLAVLVLTPIAIPEILMGVSLLIFFVMLNLMVDVVQANVAGEPLQHFGQFIIRTPLQGRQHDLDDRLGGAGSAQSPWLARSDDPALA